eukprot:TRINITY_DN8645_c1_g1_i2.p1 TRINITY_DN8645_c1_g1~~TRINITY_DN8645_c1_g1_i2.p1  ORF type:complete len:289 (-),score=91.58 TRINITY_DN8645_c1_g1_i2:99-965(-)
MEGWFDLGEDVFSGTKTRAENRQKIEYNPKIESPLDFLKVRPITCRKDDENELKRQSVEINYLFYCKKYRECIQKTEALLKQRLKETTKSHLTELYEMIARSHIELNETQEGLNYLLLLNNNLGTPTGATLALQARCQLKLGQFTESIKSFQQSLLLFQRDDRHWLELSKALISNPSICNNSQDLAILCALRTKSVITEFLLDTKNADSRYKSRYQSSLLDVESLLGKLPELSQKYSSNPFSMEEGQKIMEWTEDENSLWDPKFAHLLFVGEVKNESEEMEERDPSTM